MPTSTECIIYPNADNHNDHVSVYAYVASILTNFSIYVGPTLCAYPYSFYTPSISSSDRRTNSTHLISNSRSLRLLASPPPYLSLQ
jgi:hypothetical protein